MVDQFSPLPAKATGKLTGNYHRLLRTACSSLVISTLDVVLSRLGFTTDPSSSDVVDSAQPKAEIWRSHTGDNVSIRLALAVRLVVPKFTLEPDLSWLDRQLAHLVSQIKDTYAIAIGSGPSTEAAQAPAALSRSPSPTEEAAEVAIEHKAQQIMNYVRDVQDAANAKIAAAFTDYRFLWEGNTFEKQSHGGRDPTDSPSPILSTRELMEMVARAHSTEVAVLDISDLLFVGPLALHTTAVKNALVCEVEGWKGRHAADLHEHAKNQLSTLHDMLDQRERVLDSPADDIEVVRTMEAIIDTILENDTEIEYRRCRVEDLYKFLADHGKRISLDETKLVSSINHRIFQLQHKAKDSKETLEGVAKVALKRQLDKKVKAFVVDVIQFRNDFDANGPANTDISPSEAITRLRKFEKMFAHRDKKWRELVSGQKLFHEKVGTFNEAPFKP